MTSELQSDAALVENNIERNSYDKVSLTIDITPTLTMPNPDSYYQAAILLPECGLMLPRGQFRIVSKRGGRY